VKALKKIVFFDIDDTLIYHRGDKSYIPKSTKRTIKALQEQGHIVAIASGRGYIHTKHIMNALAIKDAVCFNGHMLVVDHKVIYREPLNKQDVQRLVKQVKRKIFPAIAMDEDVIYVKDFFGKIKRAFTQKVNTIEGGSKDMFTKVMTKMRREHETYFSMMVFNKKFNNQADYPALSFKKWGSRGYEVSNKGTSKLSGVLKMANHFHIKAEDIYTFGDNYNDIEMLEGVVNGIAMGNGVEEVKEVASYVTDHIDQQGIEKACKHFGLIS